MGRLEGEVALITGASAGFGAAIAEALAAEGAAVALTARSKDALDVLAAKIEATGGRTLAITGDVTEPADVEAAVAATRERFGPTTLLVNNAGIPGPYGPIGVVDPEDWWRALAIHVKAPLMFMTAVLPEMKAAKHGRIILVASSGAQRVRLAMSAYGVGKAAEVRLAEHAALDLKDEGVAVFAIHPGIAFTGMATSTLADPDAQKWAPAMIETVKARHFEADDSPAALARCGAMCVDLGSGDYDALSGRFLFPEDDFGALLAETEAGEG